MKIKPRFTLTAASVLILSLVGTLPGVAQDVNQPAPPPDQSAPPPPSGGWRKFQPQDQQAGQLPPDPGSQQSAADPAGNPPPGAPAGDPQYQQQGPQYPQQGPPPQGVPQQAPPPQGVPQQAPPPRYAPTTITLPAGTWVTIRLNEPLSSDHNQTGDAFTGTLLEPIIANGLMIARRGETVTGMVTEAQKAGRVSGVSHLKLELTGIQLADGRQIQVKTKLIDRKGNTSYGRDAFAIGATTAAGAAIGAGVNGGVGAGVGAAAGLVVSTIGVLLTRGRPTVVGPETPLTFSMETPIGLDNSQQAFQYASQQDYNAGLRPPMRPGYGSAYGPGPGYGYPPPAPYYGGYYAAPYAYGYPYAYPYWGPSLYFGFGGRWGYGGRWR
jgi:hypothetical protein